jgi:hypothetical protein
MLGVSESTFSHNVTAPLRLARASGREWVGVYAVKRHLGSLQAYYRNIQNTVRYTALAPTRFKGFWRD